jgi:hypothetical protein
MFGAAIFGAILTRRLASELTSRLGETAQQVKELPLRTKSHVEEADERRAAPPHGAASQENP